MVVVETARCSKIEKESRQAAKAPSEEKQNIR
jgi:hypothetical protein